MGYQKLRKSKYCRETLDGQESIVCNLFLTTRVQLCKYLFQRAEPSKEHFILKKLKAHFKRRRSKTGHKYLRLLHDNAPARKASIVTGFLESEKVNVLPHPLFNLTWLPVIITCFPN